MSIFGSGFGEQRDVVLAAEEGGLIVAVRKLVHGRDVVGVILRILGDLLVDCRVAGQLAA